MPATRTGKQRVPSSPTKAASNMSPLGRTDLPYSIPTHLSNSIASRTASGASTSSIPSTPLFPASNPGPKRPSHHKKRPPSHIPRPPNAFILFRANFIRDRHLHASATGPLANVSPTALSTIVGITWRNLPEDERQVWIEKARIAREEHKLLHPAYRYQPLPTAEERALNRESKRKVKEENIPKPDLERCQEISRLLVEGVRGQDLEERVAAFDSARGVQPKVEGGSHGHIPPARSSSLPTPSQKRSRPGRRPRSQSTSDSRAIENAQQSYGYSSDYARRDASFPSTPELVPGLAHEESQSSMMQSVADHAMPDLIYDGASPCSINLPEPQDVAYMPNGHHDGTYATMTLSPQGRSQSLQPTNNLHVPQPVPYSSTFTSLTSWDSGTPPNEPYYQFPYFSGYHDNIMTHETAPSHTITTAHADPYASTVPPFEFYHTLKSFEQPFDGFLTQGCAVHAFACGC